MIDFHTHIFPEKIAERTITYLSNICNMDPYTNGMKQGLLQSADEAGIDICVLLPVATTPSQFESINRFALQFQEGRLISFGAIHPENDHLKDKIRWIKEQGFKGIKLHSDYQGQYFTDLKCKRLLSYASEYDLAVVVHAGLDPFSPNDIHCTPKHIAEVIDEVQPTRLILAHMGGNTMYDDVERYLVGKNVYLDTSYVLDKMPEETFLRLVRAHGADRILFGSDSPWGGQKEFVECFQNIPLTGLERRLISEENARKLLGI